MKLHIKPTLIPVLFSLATVLLFSIAKPADAKTLVAVENTTAPVTLGDKTILIVQERLLSLSAQERAQRASARILKVAQNPLAPLNKIETIDGETSTDILYDDFVLMSITDKDAKLAHTDRQTLAGKNADLIREAILTYRKDYNVKKILIGALLALLCTGILIFLIKLINRGYDSFSPRFDAWRKKLIPHLRIQRIELLPADRLDDLFSGILRAFYFAAIIVLFYFYIPLVLSFFPWTRGLSETLLGYILSPLKSILDSALGYIPSLFFVGVVFACVHYVLKLINVIFVELERERISFPGFYPEWAKPTFQIIRSLGWIFSLVIVFPYLPGSNSPAFKGISVFVGVLFSLGSSSAIGNMVAGIILTYMRPFKVGDRVKIADTMGDVIEKSLLITRIRTIKNMDITIPNALVLSSHIANFNSHSEDEGLILHTSVTIGYDAPWVKVHELLIAAGKETENVLKNPPPFVLQTLLGDFNVSYELNVYTDKPNIMAKTYSDLHQNIQNKFNEAGVEIMSPNYTSIRDGNHVTIPENQLPKGYKPPFFRIGKSGDTEKGSHE